MGPSLRASKSIFLLFFLCFLILGDANPIYIDIDCPDSIVIIPNSTYQADLNIVLSSLSSNGTQDDGFYNTSSGQYPDIAYGLFLCRGDDSIDNCRDCVQTASREITQMCPNAKEATIWYDECLLRYSYVPLVSILDISPMIAFYDPQNISNPDQFFHLVMGTFDGLIYRVAFDPSTHMFITKEVNSTGIQTFYTMVQCSPDLSPKDCNTCLQNGLNYFPDCCYGKMGARVVMPSCFLRYETYLFYKEKAAATAPPAIPRGIEGQEKKSIGIILAFVLPVPIIAVLVSTLCYYSSIKRKNKVENGPQNEAESLQFNLGTIRAVTNNFSNANKIGEGGFGVVYKGILGDGREVAVKRLSMKSRQGGEEFKNEVLVISRIQHRNLVRLLGFCSEAEEKILIYEFLPNGNLDQFLFDAEKRAELNWPIRHNIIGGIARGICYLHEEAPISIIHHDLKGSNILLDDDMNPKISDFGLARVLQVDQSQGDTINIAGTYGYMPPEYAMNGHFSAKLDVFSFGVLLLEIVSGQRNSSLGQSGNGEDLIDKAWRHWHEGTALELMDPSLGQFCSTSEVMRCIQVGLLCVQYNVADRPTMASVVIMLNSRSITLPIPLEPASDVHVIVESLQSSEEPGTESE